MKRHKSPIASNPALLFDTIMREESFKSRAELARNIGISDSQLCRMYQGKEGVSAVTVLAIAEQLGKPLADIRELMV